MTEGEREGGREGGERRRERGRGISVNQHDDNMINKQKYN